MYMYMYSESDIVEISSGILLYNLLHAKPCMYIYLFKATPLLYHSHSVYSSLYTILHFSVAWLCFISAGVTKLCS